MSFSSLGSGDGGIATGQTGFIDKRVDPGADNPPAVAPVGVTAGYTAGVSTAVTIDGTFTGNAGPTGYTIGDVVATLKQLGVFQP